MAELRDPKNNSFVLPAWWVQLYDPIAFCQPGIPEVSVSPKLTDYELNVLAAVLSLVQVELFSGSTSKISIRSEAIAALFSSGGLRDRNRDLARTVELILALRFFQGSSDGSRSTLAMMCDSLSFRGDPTGEVIEWNIGQTAQQLAIGLIEPYSDLIRQCTDNVALSTCYGLRGPLAVWSAPWLDLSGPEQRFLLRLERAMQWDFRWMHFDGIFGERFDSLISGLKATLPQGGKTGAGHNSSVIAVQKIQQRLVEHGLLQALTEIDYLAMAPDPQLGAQLIWQVSPTRLQEFEDFSFREQASEKIIWPIYKSQIGQVIAALGMNSVGSVLGTIERGVKVACELESGNKGFAQALTVQGAMVVQQLPLFAEWVIRSRPGHPYPLPDFVGELGIDEVLETAARSFVSAFDEFQLRVKQMPEVFDRVINQPGSSLLFTKDTERHALLEKLQQGLRAQRDIAPNFAANRVKVDDVPAKVATDVVTPVAAKSPSVQGIRQTASEELQKLRTSDPIEYDQLKNRYLESLEPARRKLLIDVQRRMTPETFEQHLRHSLIKYMIENPTVWRSSSNTTSQIPRRPASSSSAIWGN